jgi:hypothetical protein
MATKALGAAADLNIADQLEAGPQPVSALARSTGADPDALYRILRALASEGVFAEDEPGVFRNTESSEGLRAADAQAFAHLFGSVFYDALRAFPERLETDFWEWLAAHPDERAAFDTAMGGGKDRTADRRRRRRRERRAAAGIAAAPAGVARDRVRPAGDGARRERVRRRARLRRGKLLRLGPRR